MIYLQCSFKSFFKASLNICP